MSWDAYRSLALVGRQREAGQCVLEEGLEVVAAQKPSAVETLRAVPRHTGPERLDAQLIEETGALQSRNAAERKGKATPGVLQCRLAQIHLGPRRRSAWCRRCHVRRRRRGSDRRRNPFEANSCCHAEGTSLHCLRSGRRVRRLSCGKATTACAHGKAFPKVPGFRRFRGSDVSGIPRVPGFRPCRRAGQFSVGMAAAPGIEHGNGTSPVPPSFIALERTANADLVPGPSHVGHSHPDPTHWAHLPAPPACPMYRPAAKSFSLNELKAWRQSTKQ